MASSKKNQQLVKAFVRIRPLTNNEKISNYSTIVKTTFRDELVIGSGTNEKKYVFDQVFPQQVSQEEVYHVVVSPLIDFSISGYNCTVFAYGQTGTGKTYTMIGDTSDVLSNVDEDAEFGLIPRAASHLFANLSKLGLKYTVLLSFLEIYNEEVRDLLTKDCVQLRIYEDPDNKGSTCVKGLSEVTVCNANDVYEWLRIGLKERQTAATNLNRHSSRSHTIFTLQVCTREITPNDEEIIKSGKLNLIDLAGSENINRSGATEMRAREAGTINKSLLTLGKVIKALAQKMQHVPYRDSKLTRILQDSLGGNAKTSMIATFSPCSNAWDETVSTLDYAQDARRVAVTPKININFKAVPGLKRLKAEIAKIRQEIANLRKSECFYISRESYTELTNDVTKKSEQICRLQEETQRLTEIIRDKERQFLTCKESFEKTNAYLASIESDLQTRTDQQAKNDCFIRYMSQRQSKLAKKNAEFRDMCTIFTQHVDILIKKYDAQCNFSLNNAKIATNTDSIVSQCFEEIDKTSENVGKKTINNLNLVVKFMQESKNYFKESQELLCATLIDFEKLQTTNILDLKPALYKYTENLQQIFENTIKSIPSENMCDTRSAVCKLYNFIAQYKEQSDILLADLRKRIADENDERCQFLDSFITTQCKVKQCTKDLQEQKKKQDEESRVLKEIFSQRFAERNREKDEICNKFSILQNIDCSLLHTLIKKYEEDCHTEEGSVYLKRLTEEHKRFVKDETILLEETVNIFEKNQKSVKTLISNAERDVERSNTSLHAALKAEISAYNNGMKISFREMCQKQKQFGEEFQIHVQNNVETTYRVLKDIIDSIKQQNENLEKHIEQNVEELNILKGNVIRTQSSGETPSKGDFKLSSNAERRLSINTVFKQINQNGSRSSNGNNNFISEI